MASPPLLYSSLVLFSFLLSTTIASGHGGFRVELLHRDSPRSPYFNPSRTHFDRVQAAAHRSRSRANSLARSASNGSSFQSEVIPYEFEYLMTIYVGTPPYKLLAIADTGSDITWTQCKPCVTCYNQTAPLFDPDNSSTYRELSCDAQLCQELENTACSAKDNDCLYQVLYGDGSHTSGVLASETFGFDATSGGRRVSIPKMVFGCSHETNGSFHARSSGLAGLGQGPSSLITQLGSTIAYKFSYCLVPYSDNSSTSLLSFGESAVVAGDKVVTTPLADGSASYFYYVTLESITVGEEEAINVATRSSPFDDAEPEGNIIVDSGTTLIILEQDWVQQVEDKVSSLVKLPSVEPVSPLSLCYNASGSSDSDLPDITFDFSGGPVKLSPMHTFVKTEEDVLCLGILPDKQSIYGNIAQQNFHIGFDLVAKTLSIAPADCANL